jgi:hypothetical protein
MATDGLPLALDQAGAFIEEQGSSLGEYLGLFETEKAALLQERGELAGDHPSVWVTFSLAFAKVAEANPASADLVRVCAFPAPMPSRRSCSTRGRRCWGTVSVPWRISPDSAPRRWGKPAGFP